jgi:hypothetical protein
MLIIPRSLLIVCESKILVLDLLTKKVEEVSKSVLDGKSATCAAFLFLGGQVNAAKLSS